MNPHVLRGSVSWLQSSGACEIAVAFGASLLRGEIAVVLVSRRKRRVGLLSPASGGFVVDSRKQVIRVGFFPADPLVVLPLRFDGVLPSGLATRQNTSHSCVIRLEDKLGINLCVPAARPRRA